MQITKSPTFCSAPWTSLNIDQVGRVSPCMHMYADDVVGNIKKNSIQEIIKGPRFNSVREHMAQGQWHPSCWQCKQAEETTGASARTVRNSSAETLSKIDQDINYFSLEHIVVNWSNLCNLTCVYCNPDTSTAWQSIKGIPINRVKNEHQDLIELVQQHRHTIVGLTLSGGEPLLQKGLHEFLKCLIPEQVSVIVTTNLSVDLTTNPIYNELRSWPNVNWMISFDNSSKDKFEYVRDRASWDVFYNNIKIMKHDHQRVTAHPAYSIYCAFDLIEYYDFCVSEDLGIFWCELTHPWDLDIRRYSKDLRQQAIDEIDRVLTKYGKYKNLAIDTLQGYRRTLVDNSYLINSQFCPDPIGFHRRTDTELKKTITFEQLWPKFNLPDNHHE